MKRLLSIITILALIALHSQSWAAGILMSGSGSGEAAAVLTDSCTSGLLFSWHAENADVTLGGVAGGVNNGCSAGDTTATFATGCALSATQHQDGSGSIYCTTDAGVASFDVASIANGTHGTIYLYFRASTLVSNSTIMRVHFGDSPSVDYLELYVYNSTGPIFGITWRHAESIQGAARTYSNSGWVADTWQLITVKYDTTAHSGNYLSLQVGSGDVAYGTDAITASTSTGGHVMVGGNGWGNPNMTFYVDNIQIYDTWK